MAATLLLVAPGSAAAAGWTPQAEPGLFATGGSWAQQAIPAEQGPNGRLAAVSCSSSTSCMAVGSFIDPAVKQRATSQVWNGSTWTTKAVPLPAGATRSRLAGVSCTAANACTAVGSYALPRLDNGFTPDQNPLVARWNGTAWALQTVPLPEGTDLAYLNGVSCTATGGCKAVGGYRTGSTGNGALIEHFDGSSWTFRTPPNPAGATAASLNGVSCTGTVCMAVGHYATQTGRLPSRAFAERFDGTGWSEKPVPTPSGATVVNVNGVSCTSATACTAVGGYSTAPGHQEPDKPLAARWDGATWAQQTTPAEPPSVQFRTFLAVSCVTASSCTAVGDDRDTSAEAGAGPPLVQHWDGTSWAVQPAPKPSGSGRIVAWFEGVSCTSGGCTAVGASSAVEQTSQATATLAERQTAPDAAWRIQDSRNGVGAFPTRAHGVSCASATWCVAVGIHDSPAEAAGATIARWDGTGWATQTPGARFGSGTLGDFLGGVSCTAANACMAVGGYDEPWPEHPAVGFHRPLAQRWNGTSWTSTKLPVPAGVTSTQNVSLVSVDCASATACIAVGSNNEATPLVEHWDGASWTIKTVPLPAGTVRSTLNDVSCTAPDACTAVGGYSLDQNHLSEAPLILRWNGTSWTRQTGVAPDGAKYAALTSVSCTPPKPCTAAGESSTTSYYFGTESLVQRWNGTSWALQTAAYPGLNRVSCPTLTSCTGVGGVSPSQEWDGTSWAFKGPGLVGQQNGVSCTDASECTAVGTSIDGRLLRQNLLAGLQLMQITVAPTAGRWAEPVVPQSYSIEDESVVEGDGGSGATTMTFTVTRTKTEEAGSVEVRLEPGTASFPGDFGATASVTVNFAAGAATATVNVPVNGDQAPENDETFTVRTNAGGDDIDGTATGTIVDDDAPVVSIGDAPDVVEGAPGTTKELRFPVTLSAASPKMVQVAYHTEDGSADAGSDYQQNTGTLVFEPGVVTGTVVVTVNGDAQVEADETLRVLLDDPSNAVVGTATGEGTIVNDDQPVVSIGNAPNVAEGAPGATAEMRFPVTLSTASPKAVKVGYHTQDASATAPADYETKTGTLTIPAGQLTGTVAVPVTGDALVEADETLSVELENPVDATVGTATATGTIVDDDDEPVVSIGDAPDVKEGAAGATAELRFPVTLSAPSPIAVKVDYSTEDGSATASSDYQATAGTLTIPAGEVTATVVVTVIGDGNAEPDESFGVRLENPVDVIVGTAAAQGRIVNDDTAPPPPPPGPSPSPSPSPGPGPGVVPVAPPVDVVGPLIQIPSANKALTATASGAVPFALGPMAEDTTGVISIKTDGKVSAARAAAKKKKVLALGSKAFQALKGQKIVVKVGLSGAGRKLLKKRKKIKAQANITLRDGRGNATVKAYRFTIKAPKKRTGR